jgi:hypothetical protein
MTLVDHFDMRLGKRPVRHTRGGFNSYITSLFAALRAPPECEYRREQGFEWF